MRPVSPEDPKCFDLRCLCSLRPAGPVTCRLPGAALLEATREPRTGRWGEKPVRIAGQRACSERGTEGDRLSWKAPTNSRDPELLGAPERLGGSLAEGAASKSVPTMGRESLSSAGLARNYPNPNVYRSIDNWDARTFLSTNRSSCSSAGRRTTSSTTRSSRVSTRRRGTTHPALRSTPRSATTQEPRLAAGWSSLCGCISRRRPTNPPLPAALRAGSGPQARHRSGNLLF
jgi:hypothetical protein